MTCTSFFCYVYTYAYDNQTISSTRPAPPHPAPGPAGNKDIPGIDKQNKYRAYGDIFKVGKTMALGTARFGLWHEKSDTDRHQYDLDLTLGNIRDPRETKPTPVQNASAISPTSMSRTASPGRLRPMSTSAA